MSDARWVRIGVVTRPHGVKGAVRLHLDNPHSELLAPGLKVRLVPGPRAPRKAGERLSAIERVHGGDRVELEGLAGRDEAEALRGYEVQVDRDDFPEPDEGEAYLVDLLGAEVQLPSGEVLGVIRRFDDNTAQTLAVVETPSGDVDMPLVAGIVVELDPEAGVVVVDPPEGLFFGEADEALPEGAPDERKR